GTQLGSSVVASSVRAWTIADIDINNGMTSNAPAGAVWILNLDGTEFRYTTKVNNESLTIVASGLADAVNQGGTRFAAKYRSATLKLAGTPHAGDVWTLMLDTTPVTYTVLASDTLDTIALALRNGIAAVAGYTASNTGPKVTFSKATAFAAKLALTGTN